MPEELTELAKRRGFFSPTAESYGGVAGFQTFGPEGAELKRNLENSWREVFSSSLGHREIEAPTVMPEAVFEASGHLETFDDMVIECPECGASSRADHIVEDETDVEEAESFSREQIEALFEEHDLRCPECGTSLAGEEVEDFNLMFETSIGPEGDQKGFLRPETAQGIFVEFPRFREYARNQLPFGITQVGKAYRNEISPRKGLVRVREMTQAELEHFIDPEKDSPDLGELENVELKLYGRDAQEEGREPETMTVREAIDSGTVESEWIAYYLGIARKWYESIGIDMERFRFRQHQDDELSHYASDCWDAETEVDGDWIEITGFAYRGCYDLKKHAEHSDNDYTVFKQFEESRKVEKTETEVDLSKLGPKFGDKATRIASELEKIAKEQPERLDSDTVEIDLNGGIEVNTDVIEFEEKTVEKPGEAIFPHVVEPSFGIDRILYSVMAHSLESDEVDGEERTLLSLPPEIAPTEVAVFPLMDRDGMGEKAREIAENLRSADFSVDYDNSGAIGRRYRRQDEVGTPFCVTVDHQTLEDDTVTIRERDSTDQVRVERNNLESVLEDLLNGKDFGDL